MKHIYYFIAGLLVASVLMGVWQPPVGRYQLIYRGEGTPVKVDTATGRIWGFTDKQWAELPRE